MTRSGKQLLGTLLTTLLYVAAVPSAWAVDTSKWKCEYCPFEEGLKGDYDLGATTVSEDSAYFGNATGYDEEGVYANIDGDGSYNSENQQMRWILEDLGLDSRFAELEGGNQGKYDYEASWREIPKRRFFTTDSIFEQPAAAELTLPAGWVRAPDTSGFTELESSLRPRDIVADRSILELGGRYLASKNISFSADASRQEVDGYTMAGGPFFFQSSQLPERIDYTTDEVDLGFAYTAGKGYLAVNWRLSAFKNDNLAQRWENPFSSGIGADRGELAQAPDNTFQQLGLSGTYRLDRWRTVLGLSAAAGRLEQDEDLLPYTTNAGLGAGSLPVASPDAKVDTTNLAFTVNSTLTAKANLRASLRYDERDNKTQQYLWDRVITDSFLSADTEANIPYSYERTAFDLKGEYAFNDQWRALAGYEYRKMDRDFQEVAEQTENGGWGRLRWRASPSFELDVSGGASQRTFDSYDEDVAAEFGQNPLMRKYNLAYRYRYFGRVTASINPQESPISLTLNGQFANDDYGRSTLGLLEGNDLNLNADLGWVVSDKTSFYLSADYQNVDSTQSGSELFGNPDWDATNDDTFYNLGVGVRVREIAGKTDMQLDYTYSDGTSEIRVDSLSGGQSGLPDLTSKLDYLRFKVAYRYTERTEFTARVIYQRFKADDWALKDVDPDTIATVLSLGADPYDDEQVLFSLGFRYKVGTAAEPRP